LAALSHTISNGIYMTNTIYNFKLIHYCLIIQRFIIQIVKQFYK